MEVDFKLFAGNGRFKPAVFYNGLRVIVNRGQSVWLLR